jgi:hypothetical protein
MLSATKVGGISMSAAAEKFAGISPTPEKGFSSSATCLPKHWGFSRHSSRNRVARLPSVGFA